MKRRRLNTRFPAAKIKKIMQSDDDVGKVAKAVPLLVSKALELFLQELCDRTYEITTTRGAKILSSLHLKQCVQKFDVFDFLRDIVNKVPELEKYTAASTDDRLIGRKRKLADSDDENRRVKGRGRGHGRGNRATKCDKLEEDFNMNDIQTRRPVRNFDLNVDLDENGNPVSVPTTGDDISSADESVEETVHCNDPVMSSSSNEATTEDNEDYDTKDLLNHPSRSNSEKESMENDPVMFSSSKEATTEDNEDYDTKDLLNHPNRSNSEEASMENDPVMFSSLNEATAEDNEDYDAED